MIPVIETGAENDHRAAAGLLRRVGELARDLDDRLTRYTRHLLGPGGGEGHVVVIALRDVLAAKAPVDAVIGAEQVEDGSDMGGTAIRSEEHTSELQSLMRILYAVFCLKKKKKTQQE